MSPNKPRSLTWIRNGKVIEDVIETFDLQPGARRTGATFDRFGLFNMQTGGHYVYIYIDDLTYSKRR